MTWQEHTVNNNPVIIKLDSASQGVERLFVLAFNDVNSDAYKVERKSHESIFSKSGNK